MNGPVVVDCAALQSPTSRGRGIGRYAKHWACALERERPDLVGAYLLDPAFPPPGEIEELLASGKVAWRNEDTSWRAARVYHCLSPLDLAVGLETLWPRPVFANELAMSATVYDLIPALAPDRELRDPIQRRAYRIRLELLRRADQFHAISEKVARDLVAVLDAAPDTIVTAGTAPEARFLSACTAARERSIDASLEAMGVRAPYVLYPTGSHPRKHNEGLLDAWGELPEATRTATTLVLVGELPDSMANHFHHLAERSGFASRLVLTGVVSDEELLELYRGARLVCFPSLDEGFGLPIAEAIAVGTPVIATDRAPFDELLGDAARFDPLDRKAFAGAIERGLHDEAYRSALHASVVTPRRIEEVARASADGFDRLLARTTASGSSRRLRGRPRLAIVSPFPPTQSGVAAYSHRLVEALRDTGAVAIDAFCDGPVEHQAPPEGVGVHELSGFDLIEAALGGFDTVLYALGNSHYHHGALTMLRRRGGVVLAHDVRLTNLYRYEVGALAPPGGMSGLIAAMYGGRDLPEGLGAAGVSLEEEERFGLLMAREAIDASSLFLVSSQASAALARLDAGFGASDKIATLLFAFARREPVGALLEAERDPGAHDVVDRLVAAVGPVIAHFGIVDQAKRPFVLLEAVALVAKEVPGLTLAFVGLASNEIVEAVSEYARGLGIGEQVVCTGSVSARDYQRALDATTVAVQLRSFSNGEASAAVGECLASGVATIVSDLGWTRELPAHAVRRVSRYADRDELAGTLLELLRDETERRALRYGALAEAARRTFAASAAALLELVL